MILTIGMPSYNNLEEVWWTCQALRMYHDMTSVELLVVDNFGNDGLRDKLKGLHNVVKYVRYTDTQSPAHAKNKVFEEASGEWVLCIDSHIMLKQGSVGLLKHWINTHKDCMDLIQGPLLYDNLITTADRFRDVWSGHMWGQWQSGIEDPNQAYEIQFQGCGLLGCRKDAWLGFSDKFIGFGGEEGYIQEKFRQAGRKTLCLPFLQWLHYFQTVGGRVTAPYSPKLSDRIHNYKVGFEELGLDVQPILDHFKITKEQLAKY